MPEIRCSHRLPNPQTAGAVSWDALRKWAKDSPHLRPCPLRKGSSGNWWWVDRNLCEKCSEAVRQ